MGYLETSHPFAVWLRQSNWTARTLSQKLGVSRAAIYSWAAGHSAPRMVHLAALSKITNNEVHPWMFVASNSGAA